MNIGKEEVNGGFTWRGSGEICIFRGQECKKVAVHEMIHTLALDYDVEEDLRESQVETWATILNVIFTVIESGRQPNLEIVGTLLSLEASFSLLQMEKVKRKINCDFSKPTPTPIIGYYIVKGMLLWKLSDFMRIHDDSKNPIKFPVPREREFASLVRSMLSDSKCNEDMSDKILQLKKTDKNSKWTMGSLRMSCVEI